MFTAIVVLNGCFAVFTQCWCVVSIVWGLIVGHSRCIMVGVLGGKYRLLVLLVFTYVFVVGSSVVGFCWAGKDVGGFAF